MKRAIFVLFACMAIVGCYATVSINSPDFGEVEYTRLGGQEITGLSISKDGNNIDVEVESLKAQDTSIDDAIDLLEAVK